MTRGIAKPGRLATVGAVIAAILSSACCWLPLLLLGLGISGSVMATTFGSLRPWLLPLSLVLLGAGWYFTLRPMRPDNSACSTGKESCCTTESNLRPGHRFNLTMLVIATVMVGVFAFFPNYLGALLPDQSVPASTQGITTIVDIEGMTCAGCEVSVSEHLSKIPGVDVVKVDHLAGQAVVRSAAPLPDSLLIQAVTASGYRLTGTKQGPTHGGSTAGK